MRRSRGIVIVAVFVVLFGVLLAVVPRHRATGRVASATSQSSGGASGGAARTSGRAAAGTRSGARLASAPLFPAPVAGLEAGPNLVPGSNPSVLPSDVLIADRSNNRVIIVDPAGKIVWQFPRPGDLAPGQSFLIPDDAFFTPNGQDIVTTEEDDQVISLISIAQHKILWRYGTPGVNGSTANHVSNPDDAMMLPNGDIIVADIKNCSILILRPGLQVPIKRIGENNTACYHQPPLRFGSPNGAFPLNDGNYLITEINGDWVSEMSLSGKVLWSTNAPGVAYPSDTNEVAPDRFVTADYSTPGQVVEFNSAGQLLWRYGPSSGPGMMNQPSLCRPIPTNGDVLCNDDSNDRVIVIDPRTNKIVWQYGHTGVPSAAPGYLHQPDGVDLAPPYSLTVAHAPTMGLPTGRCSASAPPGTCTFYDSSGAPSSTPTSVTQLGLVGRGVGTGATNVSSPTSPAKGSAARSASRRHRAAGPARGSSTAATSTATASVAAPLPQALSREVVVPIGTRNAAILGGLDASNVSLSGVGLLSLPSGRVTASGSIAGPLHDAAGAVLGGRAYLFGGGTAASVSTVQSLVLPSVVNGRVRASGSLRAVVVGQLPAPRSDSTAVTSGGTAYIVGGYDGVSADRSVLATTDGRRFSAVADLAVPVRYPAVAASGGRLYIFGGQAVGGANAGQAVTTVQMVDPRSGRATVIGRLPQPLVGAAAAIVGGKIELAGGDTATTPGGGGTGTVSTVWRYSPDGGRFSVIGHLGVPVSHAGIVTLASGSWLVGGETDGNAVTAVQRIPG